MAGTVLSIADRSSHLSSQKPNDVRGMKTPFYSQGKCQKSLPETTLSVVSPPSSKTFDGSQLIRIKAQPLSQHIRPSKVCPEPPFLQYFLLHSCQTGPFTGLNPNRSNLLSPWLGLAACLCLSLHSSFIHLLTSSYGVDLIYVRLCARHVGGTVLTRHCPSTLLDPYPLTRDTNFIQIFAKTWTSAKGSLKMC